VVDTKYKMKSIAAVLAVGLLASASLAGPYSSGMADPSNSYDAGIPGFVGPAGDGVTGNGNVLNPDFLGWATGYVNYLPGSNISDGYWMDATRALGPATGNHIESVVSLGDLSQTEINGGTAPGEITMTFATPIANGDGADLAVFENGLVETGTGKVFAELAYVEVSSDGLNFARFPSDSLTASPVSAYGAIDVTNVFNLAGKHANNNASATTVGDSWGTPFDLEDLLDHVLVTTGLLDLDAVNYVKVVDIPGTGDFVDADGDPIYDAWMTQGSGGFELEAIGVLNHPQAGPEFDFDGDGDVDADDVDLLCAAVGAGSSDLSYDADGDGDVDEDDMVALVETFVEYDTDGDGSADGTGSFRGDFNLDGGVNGTDLSILAGGFGSGMGFAGGNANCDTTVNGTDLSILASNFGNVATAAVPEPATLILLASAGAMGLLRRKR
jgi:hypothetical protein